MRKIKKPVSTFLSILLLTAALSGGFALAGELDNVNINIRQDDLLDIVLTLGKSDSQVTTFAEDLTAALVDKGVPEDNINITAVEANEVSAGNTSSGWKIYDHYGSWGEDPYPSPDNTHSGQNHIIVKNSGQQITFYGYGVPAYIDFMVMPNSDSTEKTFTFTMDDANIKSHSMLGAGFLFNTQITNLGSYSTQTISGRSTVTDSALNSQYISGYLIMMYKSGSGSYPILYRIDNMSMKSFHDSASNVMSATGSTAGITLLQSYSGNLLSGTHSITVKVSGDTVNMTDTVGGTTKTLNYTGLSDTGSYGFGPVSIYNSHSCNELSWFNFENLHMETTSARRFSEVIREPEWRDGSKRFIINAEDGAVSDFSDAAALGEILARLGNEGIHYIGWGKNAADGTAFVTKNSGNGTYVDKTVGQTDSYAEQIAAMAVYIYNNYYNSVENDTEYLVYGKQSSMSVSPESARTNTADESWPNGRWRVDQNPDYYENPTGTVPYDNLYLNNLDISFTETGEYKIYYQDELLKTVYVHRKPVAGFSVSMDASHNVTITDNAYDPDTQSAPDKGIESAIWKYKKTTDTEWTDGKPETLESGYNFIIMQTVTDNYGVASTPYYRYVSTVAGAETAPVAEFTVTPSTLLTYISNTLSYSDTSYDPSGASISSRQWTITKDGATAPLYTGSTAMTDFTGVAAGRYKISLAVTSSEGVTSEEVSRYLTVVRDTAAPIAASDPASGSYNTPKTVTLTFSDETGGSGFSYRYAVVTHSTDIPATWGSMGTNSTYSVAVETPGVNYIHYKIRDYAGNEATGYFGPFTITDISAPTAPVISVSPAYADGTWTNQTSTVSAAGSTDDFTADEDIIYLVSTDGTSFIPGDSVVLSTTGTHTVYFKVTDGSSNSTTVSRTVKIDMDSPAMPDITLTSDGSSYTEGAWAAHSVAASLSGGLDTGGSGFSGYQYKIGNGDWQSGSSYVFNSSGEFTIYYRSMDAVGNTSEAGSKNVKVDLEAPGEPTIQYDPEYTTEWTNQTITLTAQLASDNLTDPADITYEVSTDDVTFTAGNGIMLSDEGEHTVYFRVTDAGGNTTTVSRTVNIDKTPSAVPDIVMVSNGETYTEDTWTPASVEFTLSGGADTGGSGLAGYQYRINDGDWQNGDSYTLDASGVYTVRYRGVDEAGNYSDAGSKTVKIDLDAPEDFSFRTSITTIDSIDIAAETTDTLSGVSAYRVFNGTGWSDWQSSVNQTLSGYTRAQTVTLKVEARDAVGNVRVAEGTVTTLLNTVPKAAGDTYTMNEDAGRKVLDVLINDKDADAGDSLTVSEISQLSDPDFGTLTLSGGTVQFKPAADCNGTATFTYTAKDLYNATSIASVTLTVAPVNDAPVAADDKVSAKEDTESTFAVLKNDVDIDSQIGVSSFTQPSHGTVTRNGSGLKYMPEFDYNGSDSFTYTITDGEYPSTATVSITVESVNDEPVVSDDEASTYYGQQVKIDVLGNDSDIDRDTLKLTAVTDPEHGNARISENQIVYLPDSGFTGSDHFTYTAMDNKAQVSAKVTVEVSYPRSMTSSSTILSPQDLTGGDENGGEAGGIGSGSIGNGAAGDDATETGGLTILSPPSSGTLTQEGDTVVYTPDEDSSGVDTYRITLGQNGSAVEYLVATNTNPQTGEAVTIGYGLPISEGSIPVNLGGQITLDLSQYVDADLSAATITVNGAPVNGTVEIVDGKLVYTPAEGFMGTDAMIVTVTIDGEEIPYAIAFNVQEAQPLVTWFCIIGWIIAAVLLLINFLAHRNYFADKARRTILYVALGAAILFLLCWLKQYIGYYTGIGLAVYIAGCYLITAQRHLATDREKNPERRSKR